MTTRTRALVLLSLPFTLPFAVAAAASALPPGPRPVLLGWSAGALATLGVVFASVAIWRHWSGTPLRYFFAGAAVWMVGVGLKYLFAALFYDPGLSLAKAHLSPAGYLLAGSLYGGLYTGVLEDGVTLAAGFIWVGLAREARRAIAVGVGAGAVEALLLAALPLLPLILVPLSYSLLSPAEQRSLLADLHDPGAAAPWLMPPFERAFTVLAHVSSRVLVLLTVATGRWRYFLCGFLLSVGIDGLATTFDLTGLLNTLSGWWIELALLPFGLVAIPVCIWSLRHWPAVARPAVEVAPPQ